MSAPPCQITKAVIMFWMIFASVNPVNVLFSRYETIALAPAKTADVEIAVILTILGFTTNAGLDRFSPGLFGPAGSTVEEFILEHFGLDAVSCN